MSGESSLVVKDVFNPSVSALKAGHSVPAILVLWKLERMSWMVSLFVSIRLCGSVILETFLLYFHIHSVSIFKYVHSAPIFIRNLI